MNWVVLWGCSWVFLAVQAEGGTAHALGGTVAQILNSFQGIVATISKSVGASAFRLLIIDNVIGLGLMQKQKSTILTSTGKYYI